MLGPTSQGTEEWFMGRRWVGIAFLLVGLAGAWGICRSCDDKRCREELARAREEVSSGRYGNAREILSSLLERRPGWDEAAYELGAGEQAGGRVEAALETWEKVRQDSPLAGWVEVRRSRIELGRG